MPTIDFNKLFTEVGPLATFTAFVCWFAVQQYRDARRERDKWCTSIEKLTTSIEKLAAYLEGAGR